jgi:hypothetical protein
MRSAFLHVKLQARTASVNAQVTKAKTVSADIEPTIKSTADQLDTVSLEKLDAAFKTVSTEIGVDKENARKLKSLDERVAQTTLQLEKLKQEIDHLKGSPERMHSIAKSRSDAYEQYFELVVREQHILEELYKPLAESLSDQEAAASVQLLKLVVVRTVDVDVWAVRGEELLDLRKNGQFRGRGTLAAEARKRLLPTWQSGSAADVSAAMEKFRSDFDQALIEQAAVERDAPEYQQWTLDVGRWLYSVDHIQVSFSFEYDNISLSQLSPGSRGIVLLLLYLALDLDDHRPLIIDQPEENLDPRVSVHVLWWQSPEVFLKYARDQRVYRSRVLAIWP